MWLLPELRPTYLCVFSFAYFIVTLLFPRSKFASLDCNEHVSPCCTFTNTVLMLFSAAASPQGGYYCTIVNCQTKSIAPTEVLHLKLIVQDTPTA